MNLLLDTAAFLWLCAGSDRLSGASSSALSNSGNSVRVSAVTAWELGLKCARGKLELPQPLPAWFPVMLEHHRIELIPIQAATAIASTLLPEIHRDPFDRLLVATALEHGLTLVTPDTLIPTYPNLKTLW